MVRLSYVAVFVFVIVIYSANSYPQPQQSQNVGTFLSQLLRDYVPQNTRQYTILSGQPPNLNSPNGRIGAGPVKQATPNLSQFMMLPQNSNPQDIWSPSFNQFSPLGRSDVPFAAPLQQLHHEIANEPEIITVDQFNHAQPQHHESVEFQIESQMGF